MRRTSSCPGNPPSMVFGDHTAASPHVPFLQAWLAVCFPPHLHLCLLLLPGWVGPDVCLPPPVPFPWCALRCMQQGAHPKGQTSSRCPQACQHSATGESMGVQLQQDMCLWLALPPGAVCVRHDAPPFPPLGVNPHSLSPCVSPATHLNTPSSTLA